MNRWFAYVAWHEFLLALWDGWRPPMWPLVNDLRLEEHGLTMERRATMESIDRTRGSAAPAGGDDA